jgi:hypothetical protein
MAILQPARRISEWKILPSTSSNECGSILGYHIPSSLTKTTSSSSHFGRVFGHCWTPISLNPLLSTPQTDGQTEVFNWMIMHILCMYNSKHPHTWDESLPYVQHSYNRSLHSSTGHIPFQVGLGFQPLGPIDVALPIATTQIDSSHVHYETNKATRFIERIQHIRQ